MNTIGATLAGALLGAFLVNKVRPVKFAGIADMKKQVATNVVLGVVVGGLAGAALLGGKRGS